MAGMGCWMSAIAEPADFGQNRVKSKGLQHTYEMALGHARVYNDLRELRG